MNGLVFWSFFFGSLTGQVIRWWIDRERFAQLRAFHEAERRELMRQLRPR